MHLDPRMSAIVIAAQSFLMGGLLLAVASGRPGIAPRSLALRGLAMLLQGGGYTLIGQRGLIDSLWSGPLSMGLVMLGHGLTLVGLRMLLGEREYRWGTGLVLICLWAAMFWPAWKEPNGEVVTTLRQIYSMGYAVAVCWPVIPRLRRSRSIGERLWVGTAVFMATTQVGWLLSKAWPTYTTDASTSMILSLGALMPTLTGVAFLMMYHETIQAELQNLARIDPLTGVKNRRALTEHLQSAMSRVDTPQRVAVLVIDVDRFKQVNDRFGHAAGDRLLIDIATQLGRTIRRRDVLGRLGGEEFVVVASVQDADEAVELGERLRKSIEASTTFIDGEPVRPTVSIGVAIATQRNETAGSIFDDADRALYRAKEAGRNRVVAWSRR